MSIGLRAGTNNDGYLQVNGTDVLTALSSGNIGIGTGTPLANLHIESSAYPTLKLQNTSGASGFPVLQIINNISGQRNYQIENGRDSGCLQIRDNSAAVTRLTLTSSGNVGIGTTNPSAKLHVVGGGKLEGNYDITNRFEFQSGDGFLSYGLFSAEDDMTIYGRYDTHLGLVINPATGSGYVGGIVIESSYNRGYDHPEVITLNTNTSIAGNFEPEADATRNLGSATKRWANIYSADLQLSNEGSANDVDGTWGQYTIQEGENDLFLLNRRNGKKYKFVLQEVN